MRFDALARDTATPVPLSRWDVSTVALVDGVRPGQFASFLSHIENFDAAAFGVSHAGTIPFLQCTFCVPCLLCTTASPTEAVAMDPQQRLLLHTACEAMHGLQLPPSASCYVGIGTADYQALAQALGSVPGAFAFTANSSSVAAGRLSYVLGLHGASASIDTACSSSLVALHMAAGDIRWVIARGTTCGWYNYTNHRGGASAAALVGGVMLSLMPQPYTMLAKAGLMAPDGRCKAR